MQFSAFELPIPKVCLVCFFRHTGKVGPGIRDSRPGIHTWDPGPRNLYLGSFTWDPGRRTHKRDPGPGIFTWAPGPGTLHLGPFICDLRLYIWETGPNTFTWNAGPIKNYKSHKNGLFKPGKKLGKKIKT